MTEYYKAYDKRYRQVHEKGLSWASDCPSPIVGEVMDKHGIGRSCDILELGCGEGRDALALLRAGYSLLATDVSPEAIEFCRRLAPEHSDSFRVLDACADSLDGKFDFIYAVAVLHMLTEDSHRRSFLDFIREHLRENGLALVASQGNGEDEYCSDASQAFENAQRSHGQTGRSMSIASTTFRMVNWAGFTEQLCSAGFEITERGMTAMEPDFPLMMYAVIRKAEI